MPLLRRRVPEQGRNAKDSYPQIYPQRTVPTVPFQRLGNPRLESKSIARTKGTPHPGYGIGTL